MKQNIAAAAASPFGLESIRWSSKALAFTALDILTDPALLARIKEQHAARVRTQEEDVAAAV
ncbi:hypothetical protein [Bifidobacterium myosotis]|uniref:hypothetical protein n=1 Tax=Bifidobacterium myosotis TaxID=1630166 RepID=UPI000B9ABD6E|nr:hypothetical protein [Bifidobacterium myosotis]